MATIAIQRARLRGWKSTSETRAFPKQRVTRPGLNAEERWRTTRRYRGGERGNRERNGTRRDGADTRARGEPANTSDNDDRADRQGYTNAERRNDDIRLRVIAVLKRAIPMIEHFRDGTTEADGQNCGDDEAARSH